MLEHFYKDDCLVLSSMMYFGYYALGCEVFYWLRFLNTYSWPNTET